MRVQISEIIHEKSNITVAFSSEYGSATAFWDGPEPSINREYQVEVDIGNGLVWDIDILLNADHTNCIKTDECRIMISGDIEFVDDDGYTVLRIGKSIIPILTTGTPFPIGTNVTVSAKEITLSPFDL